MKFKKIAKRFINESKSNGYISASQQVIQQMLGIDERVAKLEERIETLTYFLNQLHSPSEIPVTNDSDLRILQECDVLILKLFQLFCKRHSLTFWLDYGTLLGAVRHNGFIPWDDDMDVAMPRDDYNKLLSLLHEDFGDMGFHANEPTSGRQIGWGYNHSKTGIWLDIFPIDVTSTEKPKEFVKEEIIKRITNYRKEYDKNWTTKDPEFLSSQRNSIINILPKGNYKIFYHGPEFNYNIIHDSEDVFPLTKTKFEDLELPIPNKTDSYLKEIYGKNYMQFPKTGILKHDLGRGALSTWAKRNNIEMNDIKKQLKDIINNYSES
jgi:lipopolysaccharide cholinephosphotransferase